MILRWMTRLSLQLQEICGAQTQSIVLYRVRPLLTLLHTRMHLPSHTAPAPKFWLDDARFVKAGSHHTN